MCLYYCMVLELVSKWLMSIVVVSSVVILIFISHFPPHFLYQFIHSL